LFPVLFHPDYDRRLRDLTGSADLGGLASGKRSRARYHDKNTSRQHYRRWGFSPRPENSVAKMRYALFFATHEFITPAKLLQAHIAFTIAAQTG